MKITEWMTLFEFLNKNNIRYNDFVSKWEKNFYHIIKNSIFLKRSTSLTTLKKLQSFILEFGFIASLDTLSDLIDNEIKKTK